VRVVKSGGVAGGGCSAGGVAARVIKPGRAFALWHRSAERVATRVIGAGLLRVRKTLPLASGQHQAKAESDELHDRLVLEV
jgi:hypothetical protein